VSADNNGHDPDTPLTGESVFDDGVTHQVDDPDNLTQQERLRELFEARRELQQYRRQLAEARATRNVPERTLRTAYRSLLEVYLRELEPLMVRRYPKQGLKHWHDADLGVAEFQARRRPALDDLPKGHAHRDTVQEPDPVAERVVGLKSIVKGDEYVEVQFTTVYGPQGNKKRTHIEQRQFGFGILDTAYRHSNAFLSEIGLEATETDTDNEFELKWTDV